MTAFHRFARRWRDNPIPRRDPLFVAFLLAVVVVMGGFVMIAPAVTT